jgi:hypothetical protein
VFIAANFPHLITPHEAIQNYVHQKSPDTVIQAVYDDFNLVLSMALPAKPIYAWCLRKLTQVKGEFLFERRQWEYNPEADLSIY